MIQRITPQDSDWPVQLERLVDPPKQLWVKGDPRWLREAQVAIVGARAATAYGTQTAARLADNLTNEGYVITSGAAYGIDGAAHRGALAAEQPTIAVMACGVDRAYPSSHEQLLSQIARVGCVVSEYEPGTTPSRTRFLERNRIIAGLSRGMVVVEASLRSGSMNAALNALAIHVPLMAVPGPVVSLQSEGCHDLIRQRKAQLVTSAQDVVETMMQFGYA